MKAIISQCIILAVLFFGIAACNENEEQSLDDQYMDSEQYQSFQDEASEEKKLNQKLDKAVEWHLQQFPDCKASRLSIPFELNYEKTASLILDASEGCIVESRGHRLKLLGESFRQDQRIRWVLLERETAYRDQEVIAATYGDDQLEGFKTVGVFRKNPSEKISSQIQVLNEAGGIRILSITTRNIFYPIDQDNVMTAEYEISESGSIRQL